MRRLRTRRSERGATAVIVAVLLVALMGFTAIAVDVGAVWWDRKQAQNGADAAALAIAQACANAEADCDAPDPSAQDYANKNRLGDDAYTGTATVDRDAQTVTAYVVTDRSHWFAPFLGVDETRVSAQAVAAWGRVTGGAGLPITFSLCEFERQTGGWDAEGNPLDPSEITVLLSTRDECSPPAHDELPGGFAWLAGTNCSINVMAGNWVPQDPGNDGSNTCRDFDWTTIRDKTVMVPIFDAVDPHFPEPDGTGQTKAYHVAGVAAFTITGYCFSVSDQWNSSRCPADKSITGHFGRYTTLTGEFRVDTGSTWFGPTQVSLVG